MTFEMFDGVDVIVGPSADAPVAESESVRCACPKVQDGCPLRATQEDGLCDYCRWHLAVVP